MGGLLTAKSFWLSQFNAAIRDRFYSVFLHGEHFRKQG
jgi:hypothetical protein